MKLISAHGRHEYKPQKIRRRILPLILIPLFLVTMVISVIELLRPNMEQNEFDNLSDIVHSAEHNGYSNTTPTVGYADTIPSGVLNEDHTETMLPQMATDPIMLPQYVSLYEKNTDLFGWLYIEGTSVDYPVMHTPDDPEFYLRTNFDGDYSVSGVPFMDSDCFEGCGNYIIYGHNMKNGTMFNSILSYKDESFWREHPTIYFDTMYQSGEYEVVAAFYSKVYNVDDTAVFRIYDYADLSDEQVFNEFMRQVTEATIYETGVVASFGDEFITLITCSYHVSNGRFVVVAKRI